MKELVPFVEVYAKIMQSLVTDPFFWSAYSAMEPARKVWEGHPVFDPWSYLNKPVNK